MADGTTEEQKLSSSSPEQEPLELSTTVDPSYIIQLIRQLIPQVHSKETEQQGIPNQEEDEKRTDKRHRKDSEENESTRIEENCNRDTGLTGRSEIHVASNFNDHLDKTMLCNREGYQSPSSEHGDHNMPQSEISPSKEGDCTDTESADVSQVSEQEEAGCMLWDLAATQSHAEFMVKNHILDVLLGILYAPHSDRIREICLGIMGNLACHAMPVKAIINTPDLPEKIVQTLFVNDAPSLSEACRLLSASLHSEEADSWVKITDSQEVLERVIWIAANTMNSLLLEKSTELLLAMVDCQGNTASVLLSALVDLGLPAVLTDLLFSEISAFNEGTCSHGNVVLDTVLQVAEALSLADDVAKQLADNLKLFSLSCQVIQLSAKEEIGPAGISAAVLVANLLAEKEELIHQIANDVVLIQQLFELLPSAGDDPGARNALWSILKRLSVVHSAAPAKDATVTNVSLVFARGANTLVEDLVDHQHMEEPEEAENTRSFSSKLETVEKLVHVLEDWLASHDSDAESDDAHDTIKNSCCFLKKYILKIEKDVKSMHDKKHKPHQNGVIKYEG